MPVSAAAESSSAAARRQPLLTPPVTSWNAGKDGPGGGVGRIGETAGECAAVCCCCPCAVVHLVILALYRLPRGIWRRRRKRKRRKMLLRKKRGKLAEEKDGNRWKIGSSLRSYTDEDDREEELGDSGDYEGENGGVDREDEVWDRFYWSGFWRSSSQREDDNDEWGET